MQAHEDLHHRGLRSQVENIEDLLRMFAEQLEQQVQLNRAGLRGQPPPQVAKSRTKSGSGRRSDRRHRAGSSRKKKATSDGAMRSSAASATEGERLVSRIASCFACGLSPCRRPCRSRRAVAPTARRSCFPVRRAVYIGDSLIYSLEVVNAEPDAPPTFGPASQAGVRDGVPSPAEQEFLEHGDHQRAGDRDERDHYVLFYRLTPRSRHVRGAVRHGRSRGPALRYKPVPFRAVGPSQRDDLRVARSERERPVCRPTDRVTLEVLIQRGASINNPVFAPAWAISSPCRSSRSPEPSIAPGSISSAPAEIEVDRVTIEDREFDRVHQPHDRSTGRRAPPRSVRAHGSPTLRHRSRRPAGRSTHQRSRSLFAAARGRSSARLHRPDRFLHGQRERNADRCPRRRSHRFELTLEGPGDLRRVPHLRSLTSGVRFVVPPADRDAERRFGDGHLPPSSEPSPMRSSRFKVVLKLRPVARRGTP